MDTPYPRARGRATQQRTMRSSHPADSEPSFREVTARELSRSTSEVLRGLNDDERIVITRHGTPIAVLLSVEQGLDFLLAHSEELVEARLVARDELGLG